MRINHNIASLNTYRQLEANSTNTQKNIEKLSSGLRINRAGDDAAGLAISEKMRGQIRGLDQASRNAQDGISLIQTAEGALNETHSILQRMRELAVQSSNDTNATTDRSAIQQEVNQLTQEIDRIANTTEFNTKTLLNGSVGLKVSNGAILTNAQSGSATVAGTYAVGGTVVLATAAQTAAGSLTAAGDVTRATVAGAGKITINGTDVNFAAGESYSTVIARINSSVSGVTASINAGDVVIKTNNVGADQTLSVASGAGAFATGAIALTGGSARVGSNASGATWAGGAADANLAYDGNDVTVTAGNGAGIKFTVTTAGATNETITVNNALTFQIGANAGQNMSVNINAMDKTSLGVQNIDVTTQSGADSAITVVNNAITTVSTERSKLGAYQNRLEHTINNLGTSSENLTAAESRIRDVDMAKEMTEFTKNNILSQAAQAMLAQANQQPQGVLQLLR